MTETPEPDLVQSLVRGLAVIRTFDVEHPTQNLSEIAKRADISPAAARRFLQTLVHLGYVRQQGREFSLTPNVLELGFSYLSALSLPEVMQPHLEQLSQDTEESVSGAVLADGDIVYVARVSPRRIMTVGITIGTRFPAYATSMGRVLLAAQPREMLEEIPLDALTPSTVTDVDALSRELDDVDREGWALVNSELEVGLCSVAVPIRKANGAVVAAINVSTSTTRHTPDEVRDLFLPKLQATAARIEESLRLTQR